MPTDVLCSCGISYIDPAIREASKRVNDALYETVFDLASHPFDIDLEDGTYGVLTDGSIIDGIGNSITSTLPEDYLAWVNAKIKDVASDIRNDLYSIRRRYSNNGGSSSAVLRLDKLSDIKWYICEVRDKRLFILGLEHQ